MGGEPCKKEPKNCDAWKAQKEVWKILEKGNVTSYLEHLNGFKPHITMTFFKNWSNELTNHVDLKAIIHYEAIHVQVGKI